MITHDDFYKGRDLVYKDWTPEIDVQAQITMQRATWLLASFGEERAVTSGWRPAEVNAATPGATSRLKV